MRWFLPLVLTCWAAVAAAAEWDVPNRAGAISETLAQAAEGDILRLRPGTYAETLVLDRAVTLDGNTINIFLTNRANEVMDVDLVCDLDLLEVASAEVLTAAPVDARACEMSP